MRWRGGRAVQGGEQRLKVFKEIVQAPTVSKTGLALDFHGFANGHVRCRGHLWLQRAPPTAFPACRAHSVRSRT